MFSTATLFMDQKHYHLSLSSDLSELLQKIPSKDLSWSCSLLLSVPHHKPAIFDEDAQEHICTHELACIYLKVQVVNLMWRMCFKRCMDESSGAFYSPTTLSSMLTQCKFNFPICDSCQELKSWFSVLLFWSKWVKWMWCLFCRPYILPERFFLPFTEAATREELKPEAILLVTIKQAKNVPKMDVLSASDPYIRQAILETLYDFLVLCHSVVYVYSYHASLARGWQGLSFLC